MKHFVLAAFLFALTAVWAPLRAATETGVALIFTANTYGEHSPCPS
jgi:hypothetical protein